MIVTRRKMVEFSGTVQELIDVLQDENTKRYPEWEGDTLLLAELQLMAYDLENTL